MSRRTASSGLDIALLLVGYAAALVLVTSCDGDGAVDAAGPVAQDACDQPRVCPGDVCIDRACSKNADPWWSCGDQCAPQIEVDEARCFLEALRDRKIGRLTIMESPTCAHVCSEDTNVYSHGDGTASIRRDWIVDASEGEGPTTRRLLREPAWFEACLAGPEAGLETCLLDFSMGEAPGAACADYW